MTPLKTYSVTFSERIHARTEVQAPDVATAEELAARTFHQDCFKALNDNGSVSEFLEFNGPDFFDVEEVAS